MKNTLTSLVVALLVSALVACQVLPGGSSDANQTRDHSGDGFVSVVGHQFMKNGEPYYFTGTNFWYGAYLGATEEGRERLTQELDLLASIGVTNLRVLAAAEQTELTMALDPAVHLGPGQYNEQLLVGLDHLLHEMGKRNMHAVLYFTNFWQWSGGMSQYMAWLTGEAVLDPDLTGDWNSFMQNSARFYRSQQAQDWYRQLIRTIVQRTNSVSGRLYIDDPAIMSWQLANEPRPGSDEAGLPNFGHYKRWIEETATFIKSLAPKQLVSTGSEGAMGSLRDIELYAQAHATPAVDYLTFHMWPKNWSWFDIERPQATYSDALAESKAYMLQHIQVAQALNKPTVLSEFGFERDAGDYRLSSGTRYRDRFFRDIFAMIETQAKLGTPMAGSNFWTWGGYGRAQHEDFIWRAGDSVTGDPPQEHQGLNSVFDADVSTLEVISNHSKVMNRLR